MVFTQSKALCDIVKDSCIHVTCVRRKKVIWTEDGIHDVLYLTISLSGKDLHGHSTHGEHKIVAFELI